jgi:hypothetical protein
MGRRLRRGGCSWRRERMGRDGCVEVGNPARACTEGGLGVHGREVRLGRACGDRARMRSMCGWRRNGTALPAAKDTTVRCAQSETGVPKRVHGAVQMDAGRNGVANAALMRTTRGEADSGDGCTERAWQRTGGRGSGVDAGWDGRGERIQHRGRGRDGHGWEGASV